MHYYLTNYQRYYYLTEGDTFNFIKDIKAQELMEIFVLGDFITSFASIQDPKEKKFQVQKFIHSFKLELF
jgi:UDP-2,3-diacylglucosamine pyrophosphatase LpxH